MNKHKVLARRIAETAKMARRLSFLDPSLDLGGAELDLRRAYSRVADRISFLKTTHSPVAALQVKRSTYHKPRRLSRWLFGRLLGLR